MQKLNKTKICQLTSNYKQFPYEVFPLSYLK